MDSKSCEVHPQGLVMQVDTYTTFNEQSYKKKAENTSSSKWPHNVLNELPISTVVCWKCY